VVGLTPWEGLRIVTPARSLAVLLSALATLMAGARAETGFHGARGTAVLDWQNATIDRVISFTPYGLPGRTLDLAGRRCLSGYQFYFDVLDSYAHDIDEPVELTIDFAITDDAGAAELTYDANNGVSAPLVIALPSAAAAALHVAHITLPAARFAGLLEFGTDLRLAAEASPGVGARGTRPAITVCDIRVARSYATPAEAAFGWLNLVVRDEHGQPSPARLGLYDASGRLPMPEAAALPVKDFSSVSRTFLMPEGTVNWPAPNRQAFYVDGSYRARLAAGEYSLVMTKGIEYRYGRREFTIVPGETLALDVTLERWIDMPASGWRSGDVHVHIPRHDARDNQSLWRQAQAEDLHVTNSLVMGNIARTHFPQRFWGAAGSYSAGGYALVAGQEDPRTAVRGHTLQLNLEAPLRDPAQFLSYHTIAEAVREQGGISGYAHLDRLGVRVGMALDVPFGLVSFLEVLQRGELTTDVWFDFLNLGFRIAPAAGSDVPYGARIGDVRSYVQHAPDDFPGGWFTGLAAGRTFATNGPIIAFNANGTGMGEVLELAAGATLQLTASASVNPDIDRLERIELVELGERIGAQTAPAGGSEVLQLSQQLTVERSAWYVVRAYGTRAPAGAARVVAVSAPIYVRVDGEPTWQRRSVGSIVQRLKAELDAFAALQLAEAGRLDEWFETEEPWRANWALQQQALRTRIIAAKAELDRLAAQAAAQ